VKRWIALVAAPVLAIVAGYFGANWYLHTYKWRHLTPLATEFLAHAVNGDTVAVQALSADSDPGERVLAYSAAHPEAMRVAASSLQLEFGGQMGPDTVGVQFATAADLCGWGHATDVKFTFVRVGDRWRISWFGADC
jgi:hypothetical protein